MTNPSDTVGTNAGYNGRTTPNALNDILGAFSRGIVSGWACSPKSGMTIQIGGNGTTRDVAIAEDNAGNRLTINNRLGTPVDITISGAPSTGNRIDSIVAYIENPPTGAGATSVDFPDAVGIIAVSGTASGSPSAPSEATIRTAITADGATGSSAYYVVLANITVGQGVTTIGSGAIAAGAYAKIGANNFTIPDGSITTAKLASNAVTTGKIAGNAVTADKIDWSTIKKSYGHGTPDTTQNYKNYEFGSYSIAEAGVYFIAACAFINVSGAYDRSLRALNGSTELVRVTNNRTGRQAMSVFCAASCAVGDTIKFEILTANSAADFTPQNYPTYVIFRIA